MRKAVIDVGSNSVLLAIAEFDGAHWQSVYESSKVTGLGKGTKISGLLSEKGMEDTLTAVKQGFSKASELGCLQITAAATMAARIASNTPDFLARANAQHTPIWILSGEQEAELGFRAVADDPFFAREDKISIIDVGGHSTELVTGVRTPQGWRTIFKMSFSIGALGMREGLLAKDSPDIKETLEAVVQIDDTISLRFLPHSCGRVVTLGATGTNLVTIREAITEWRPELVHGAELGYEEISLSVARLFKLDDAGRRAIPGIEKGREHTLHVGALILERFLFAIGANSCTVSVRGWRHALLESGSD